MAAAAARVMLSAAEVAKHAGTCHHVAGNPKQPAGGADGALDAVRFEDPVGCAVAWLPAADAAADTKDAAAAAGSAAQRVVRHLVVAEGDGGRFRATEITPHGTYLTRTLALADGEPKLERPLSAIALGGGPGTGTGTGSGAGGVLLLDLSTAYRHDGTTGVRVSGAPGAGRAGRLTCEDGRMLDARYTVLVHGVSTRDGSKAYVCDVENARIRVLDFAHKQVATLTGAAGGKLKLSAPVSVCWDVTTAAPESALFVGDAVTLKRVDLSTGACTDVCAFEESAAEDGLLGACTTPSGHVLLIAGKSVVCVNPLTGDKAVVAGLPDATAVPDRDTPTVSTKDVNFGGPKGLAIDTECGGVFVVDNARNSVLKLMLHPALMQPYGASAAAAGDSKSAATAGAAAGGGGAALNLAQQNEALTKANAALTAEVARLKLELAAAQKALAAATAAK